MHVFPVEMAPEAGLWCEENSDGAASGARPGAIFFIFKL